MLFYCVCVIGVSCLDRLWPVHILYRSVVCRVEVAIPQTGGGGRSWWGAGAWLAPYDQGCASVCLNWSFERIT